MSSIAKEYQKKEQSKLLPPEKEARARESLWEFEKLMNPKFYRDDRWHLKEIADTLQALVEDRIIRTTKTEKWSVYSKEEKSELVASGNWFETCHRLKLNIPPRHGKSYSLSMFEQWCLGVDNENTVITVSYNGDISSRFSATVRDGIEATKIDKKLTIFSDVFPNTKIKYGDGSKSIWALAGRFFNYLGTGFGGTITGIGCRIGVIDDPIKSDMEAFNDSILEKQWNWYTDTFLSRVEEGGYFIINMTRWSSKDLCGRLEEEAEADDWYELRYPACMNAETMNPIIGCQRKQKYDGCTECTRYSECELIKNVDKDKEGNPIGKMLCEALMSYKSWRRKKLLTSPAIFEANYQQTPVDVTGALYAAGFKTYQAINQADVERKISYGDTADEGSDSLCHICADVIDRYAYVTDIYFTDAGMEVTEPETARRIKITGTKEAFIESNNGGRGFARNVERILKELKYKGLTMKWFHQNQNKQARILSHASNVLEQVIMPEGWERLYPEFYKAIMKWQRKGKNAHDDAPDALTGLIEVVNGEIKVKKKVKTISKSRLGIR